jgi:FkbM family methyltransferase
VQFIQIGAHDGQHQDPLYPWACRYPWRGVLEEPQPAMYKRLVELHASRPQISIEQAVVADRRGKAKLWTLGDSPDLPKDATLFASLDKDVVQMNVRNYFPDFENRLAPTEVEAYTLDDLMRKHGIDELDLLQIDAEGFDFKR